MDINLSFSGAGFLGIYHIGVGWCFKLYGKRLLDRITSYGGCSFGAFIAVTLLCDMEFEDMVTMFMEMASVVRESTVGWLSPKHKPVEDVRRYFTAALPENAYQMASGRLFLSLTRVSDSKHVVVSEYSSNKLLIDALVCTSFVPYWSGFTMPKFEGIEYVDGGLSNNLLQHFEGTIITVSPFSGESDICPDDGQRTNMMIDLNNSTFQLTSHNIHRITKMLNPYDTKGVSCLCREGFNDALKYIHCNYPELLSIDVDIVSIPHYNSMNVGSSNGNVLMDDDDSTCDSRYSDLEQKIAKSHAIKSLVFPKVLFDLLSKEEKKIQKSRSNIWLFLNFFITIPFYFCYPWYYIAYYLYHIAHSFFNILLSKIDYNKIIEKCLRNPKARKVLRNTKYAYETYYNSSTTKWHPSLVEERHTEILQTRDRLKSARNSIVAVRKESIPVDDCLTTPNRRKRLSVSPSGLDIPRIVRRRSMSDARR